MQVFIQQIIVCRKDINTKTNSTNGAGIKVYGTKRAVNKRITKIERQIHTENLINGGS